MAYDDAFNGMASTERPPEGAIIALQIDVQDTLRRALDAVALQQDSHKRSATDVSDFSKRENTDATVWQAFAEIEERNRVFVGYCHRHHNYDETRFTFRLHQRECEDERVPKEHRPKPIDIPVRLARPPTPSIRSPSLSSSSSGSSAWTSERKDSWSSNSSTSSRKSQKDKAPPPAPKDYPPLDTSKMTFLWQDPTVVPHSFGSRKLVKTKSKSNLKSKSSLVSLRSKAKEEPQLPPRPKTPTPTPPQREVQVRDRVDEDIIPSVRYTFDISELQVLHTPAELYSELKELQRLIQQARSPARLQFMERANKWSTKRPQTGRSITA